MFQFIILHTRSYIYIYIYIGDWLTQLLIYIITFYKWETNLLHVRNIKE